MKWLALYNKIGKQNLSKMKKSDVVVLIDNKLMPLYLKFKVDGTHYFILDLD